MSVENLVEDAINAQNTPEEFSKIVLNYIKANDSVNYYNAFKHFKKNSKRFSDAIKAIRDSANVLKDMKDIANALKFFEAIDEFLADYPSFFEELKEVIEIYEKICRAGNKLSQFAKLLEKKPVDETKMKPSEILDLYLTIANLHLQSKGISKAQQYFAKAKPYYFPNSTPLENQKVYNNTHTNLMIETKNFLAASQQLLSTYLDKKLSQGQDKQKLLLRAIIFAGVCPPGPSRDEQFQQIMKIEEAQKIPEYKLILRLNNRQIISDTEIEEFWNIIKEEESVSKQYFQANIKKHNMTQISYIYKSVSIERIAKMIGSTQAEVLNNLNSMISSHEIKAKIDQPNNKVVYHNDDVYNIDDQILEFCDKVLRLADSIQEAK
ncbi:PCI domain containing protein [Trichomonas vaginalis G3]|uniref:COP9 signalosome complex subunit 4 n=1 Tax=Trichomonas vaginalis (strain ATCC PRA-98 / G3) TaxID=412133 RepID=A2E0F3_TRIV3|nr:protein deneddylation [Trichomonas vaginalis G3]EAY13833.1 PCI domain containing protein [Trichomonas vaginalis G3]KAI5519838.1 protein deneddylation [Trichomonas vaginalis G3]|eukprot:XP_001326056.1 PCI domain containing protein [Trichomonas vaginalis G3]